MSNLIADQSLKSSKKKTNLTLKRFKYLIILKKEIERRYS